jgi:tetratricopeptide (TPR) repeat protein
MNIDPINRALNTTPSSTDTERTLGWKLILESAKVGEKRGDLAKAEQLYERALVMAAHRLGDENIIVAHILMQFAQFYESQKRHDKAAPLHARAREILAAYTQAFMTNT